MHCACRCHESNEKEVTCDRRTPSYARSTLRNLDHDLILAMLITTSAGVFPSQLNVVDEKPVLLLYQMSARQHGLPGDRGPGCPPDSQPAGWDYHNVAGLCDSQIRIPGSH